MTAHRGAQRAVPDELRDVDREAAAGERIEELAHRLPAQIEIVVRDQTSAFRHHRARALADRRRAEAAVAADERRHALADECFEQGAVIGIARYEEVRVA